MRHAPRYSSAWATQQRVLAENVERVRKQALEQTGALQRWRRRNAMGFMAGGATLGAAVMGGGMYIFVSNNPRIMERAVVFLAVRSFESGDFQKRKAVFFGLPEPTLPSLSSMVDVSMEEALAELNQPRPTPAASPSPSSSSSSSSSPIPIPNASPSPVQQQEAQPPEGKEARGGEDNAVATVTGAVGNGGQHPLDRWSGVVTDSLAKVHGSWLLRAKSEMREKLLTAVSDPKLFPDLGTRLAEVRDILPPSIERVVAVSEQVQRHVDSQRWLPAAVLESNPLPSMSSGQALNPDPCEVTTRIIITALAFFPGPINQLVHMLRDRASVKETAAALRDAGSSSGSHNGSHTGSPVDEEALIKALEAIRDIFRSLDPRIQAFVLESALTTAITALPKLSLPRPPRSPGGPGPQLTPYQLYVRAIDEDLLTHLQTSANIPQDILQQVRAPCSVPCALLSRDRKDIYSLICFSLPIPWATPWALGMSSQVKNVYLALPPYIQARVLLTALNHPSASSRRIESALASGSGSGSEPEVESAASSDAKESQAAMVRDLMASGGVVAIKLAQMIAEDPRVPKHYRDLLGSLRYTHSESPRLAHSIH